MDKKSDYRVQLTRRMFRQALTDLLREKPLQKITVKELCQLAGVNRGTFYAHYQDLYDLMEQLEREMMEELTLALARFEEQTPHTGREIPLSTYLALFQFFDKNADMCTVLLGEHSDKRFVSQLVALGREKFLEVYSRLYPQAERQKLEVYYSFAASGCIGLLEEWIESGRRVPVSVLAADVEQILTGGLRFLE